MAGTVELHTGLDALATPTVTIYPDGSDTAAETGTSATEATNRGGVYVFSNATLTGLHRIELVSGGTMRYWGWATLATTGTIVASDSRREALSVNDGYVDDYAYVHLFNGAAGTVVGVNGTITNPSDTFANAVTIATARNRQLIRATARSALNILSGTYGSKTIDLNGGALIINGATVSSCTIFSSLDGATYEPDSSGGQTQVPIGTTMRFENITIGNCLISAVAYFTNCTFIGNIETASVDSGDYVFLKNCYSGRYGVDVTFNLSGDANFSISRWYGNLTVTNMSAGQKIFIWGYGTLTIAASCTGGTINHTSHIKVTDSSGGAVTTNLVSQADPAAWTTALVESYRAAGEPGTPAQLLHEIIAHMGDSAISGTTKTIKKRDGTAAKTYTLNDASAPTAIEETT